MRARRRPACVRGGVLLEVMLALALFTGAALYTLRALSTVHEGLDRASRMQQAADIAASKLAELEAGLINTADLRETMRSIGSIELEERWADRWLVELRTQRTEHAGLSLVEITVRETAGGGSPASFTLRQLLRLREGETDEYEQDDLLRGLPMHAGGTA
jgi:hypothetical protein